MKCYYHIEYDAVGMCARCGKGLCSVCAEDIGGSLLCPGCIELAQEEERLRGEQEALDTKAETRLVVESVKKTIFWSWIVAGIFGCIVLIGFFSLPDEGMEEMSVLGRIGFCLLLTYFVWAWYWGRIFILDRWGRKVEKATGGEHGWILGLILLFVASFIGFYGGGIYYYLKYRKILKQGD